jgi:hypothetical protein
MKELAHSTTVEELVWGLVLVAVTMTLHAFAMPLTLAAANASRRRRATGRSFISGVRVLLLASGLIVIAHLLEVAAWAAFFLWRDAFPTASASFYYSLLQYTTVGSDLALPERWDLLGGMIAIAGALAFAWSTAVLLALAERFQGEQLRRLSSEHRRSHD